MVYPLRIGLAITMRQRLAYPRPRPRIEFVPGGDGFVPRRGATHAAGGAATDAARVTGSVGVEDTAEVPGAPAVAGSRR
jgi:hypothetical protein